MKVIIDLENRIEDAKLRRAAIETEAISLENLFRIMQNFGELYDIISDEERKAIITYLIKEIQIYPRDEAEQPLKSIEFNFPVYRDRKELKELMWENGNTVESYGLLRRNNAKNRRAQQGHAIRACLEHVGRSRLPSAQQSSPACR